MIGCGRLLRRCGAVYGRLRSTRSTHTTPLAFRTHTTPRRAWSAGRFQRRLFSGAANEAKKHTVSTTAKRSSWDDAKWIASFARPEVGYIALGGVALVIGAGASMYVPKGIGELIDSVAVDRDHDKLWYRTKMLAGLVCLGSVATFCRSYIFQMTGHRVVRRIRKHLYASVMNKPIGFFDKTKVGELTSRLSADASEVARSLSGVELSAGIRSVVQVMFSLSYMVSLSPELSGYVMFGVVPPVAMLLVYARSIKKLSKKVQNALADSTSTASERFSHMRTVKSFGQEQHETQRYNRQIDRVFDLSRREALLQSTFFMGSTAAGYSILIGVMYKGGLLILSDTISPGLLTSFLMYAVYIGTSVGQMSQFYGSFMKGLGASQRMAEISRMDSESTQLVKMDSMIEQKQVAQLAQGLTEGIHFKDLVFHYPARPSVPVLKGLNLSLDAGKVTAVCGPSGSGKSTLVWLLLNMYSLQRDGNSGSITIDGEQHDMLGLRDLRKLYGVVGQDAAMFSGTILENILYGVADDSLTDEGKECAGRSGGKSVRWASLGVDPEQFSQSFGGHGQEGQLGSEHVLGFTSKGLPILPETVLWALKEANALDFVLRLSDGLDTEVGERGVALSGGQRQRLALARALIVDPPILLLDEATSALDAHSEKLVQDALSRVMRGRTVLVIAHRLSTITQADRICVLSEDGQVAEQGSFAELTARDKGAFIDLMKTQLA